MASNIDPERPNVGVPRLTKDGFEDNFTAAKEEIEDLQSRVTALEGGGGGFNVDQYDIAGRLSAGSGGLEAVDIATLTDQASPASTDDLLAKRASDGALVKIEVGNLPGGAVASVFGRTGAVAAVTGDYDDAEISAAASATNYTPASSTVDGHLSGIDTALGTSGAVDSVFGRTGAVVAVSGDYDADEITETASNKIMTAAERTKLAGVATGATDDTTVDAHIADTVDAHDASAISNVPAGGIAATTVQAAIDELDSEKAAASHTHTLADVTDSGALAALATVGTTEIDNSAVTLAKMADMATDSFIGRDTAATGVPEVLSAATARSVLNVEDGANAPPFVTGDYTDASVTYAKIQDVSAQWRVLGRISTGAGDIEEIDISALTDQVSPAGGDVLFAERASDGNMVKIQVGNLPTGGGGEANLGSNLGAGIGVFESKSGVTLQFNSLVSQNTALTIAEDDANDEIDFDLDINAATDLVAPATGDELLIGDISDSNNVKKADLASIVNLADHDALTNFVADEHVAHAGVTLTAGDGLTGGGTIAASRTFDVDINGATDLAAPATGDELLLADISNANAIRKADVASVVNLADHDALTNFVADEHVAHAGVTLTAGDGLAGGGTIAASRTFDVDINATTDLASPDRADELLISDASNADAIRKADVASIIDLAKPVESFVIAASDETTALTTGTAKVTFRMPYAFTLSEVRASVTTAPTGSVLTVDINETGTTILSTKITIDATEKTSETAATAPVISDTALADDAEITIDIDTVGSTVAGAGLKVTLIGNQA